MSTYATAYATDEDVSIRCRADFELLCSREYMAQGTDGTFAAAPASPWTLTSASNDFVGQGVDSGNVLILKEPVVAFGTIGAFYVVDHLDDLGGAVLRKIGQAAGLGYPPAGVVGLANVKFIVPTLKAQIEAASYDINRRYGISDLITGRRPSDLFDIREVREVTVLDVLYRRYLDLARQAEVGGNDVYYAKSRTYNNELSDLLSRVTIHWTNSSTPSQQTTRFNTRIER